MTNWIIPSVIATMAGTALLAFVYFYLYGQDRKKYLAVWGLSWAVYCARYVFMLFIITAGPGPALLVGNQAASLLSGILLLWGTCLFIEKKFPQRWLYGGGVGALWILISVLGKFSFLLMSAPTFTFLAVVYVWTGLQLINSEITKGSEKKLTGWAFILWGVHKANYPFLRPVAWFAPWGYLIAALLEFCVALGMLLVYFQKTKQDLQQQQLLLHKAQAIGKIGTWRLDVVKDEIFWTAESYAIFGLPRDTPLSYATFLGCVHPDDRAYVDQCWQDAFKPAPYDIEHRIVVDGKIKWVREKAELEFDDSGRCVRGIGFVQDITARKLMENALAESEEKLRAMFNASPLAMVLVDKNGTVLDSNAEHAKRLNMSRDQLLGQCLWDLLPERVREHRRRRVESVFESGEPFAGEDRRGAIWNEYHIHPALKNSRGEVAAVIVEALDITARKEAEARIKESEALLNRSQETAAMGSFVWDLRNDELFWSRNMYAIHGLEESTFAGNLAAAFRRLIHPGDQDRVGMEIQKMIATGRVGSLEFRIIRPDGRERIMRSNGEFELDKGGRPIKCFGIHQDVTERKAAERERDRLSAAIEQAGEIIVITDPGGAIQYVNPAFEKVTGYTPGEVLGQNPRLLKSGKQNGEFYANLWATISSGRTWTGRLVNRAKDGRLYTEEATISPVKDATGRIINYVAVKRDMTLELNLEYQLQQAQKMESIGSLAGGIAHDFNNILFPIVGMAELLLEDLDRGSVQYENARVIFRAGKRGSDLVKQILAFSRQAEHQFTPVRLQRILNEVVKLIRSTIPANIDIVCDIQSDCGLVMADPTQIHQVAMNLLTNAYHAVEPTGGRIALRLRETAIGPEGAAGSLLEPGPHVCLSVRDNGAGIDPAIMEKIFEPYFTTKPQAKGTGLGLAVVYGIVREHKGDLTVSSEAGKGATFKIYLPRMSVGAPTQAAGESGQYPRGRERILLVDDEPAVIEVVRQMLTRLGYLVTTRVSSVEALEAFRARPGELDLVVTDMAMPGMTGDQLAGELIALRPDLPVIICTGFSERLNQKRAAAIGIKGFLMKPVIKAEMAQMVRKVLDEARGTTHQ